MKRMAYVLVALFLAVLWMSAASAADGKEVFVAQKCDMCHSVPSAGIEAKVKSEKMKGPDIDGSSSLDAETMGKYLKKQAQLEGKDHKKEFKGTDDELKALVVWLGSIKTE